MLSCNFLEARFVHKWPELARYEDGTVHSIFRRELLLHPDRFIFADNSPSLLFFCKSINLPFPFMHIPLVSSNSTNGLFTNCSFPGGFGPGGFPFHNGTSSDHVLYEPSTAITVLLSLCYGLISLGAVVGKGTNYTYSRSCQIYFKSCIGNCLVIYMVIRNRRMRTITNFFIANLALSDVVIGTFFIPFHFQAALLQRWNLPEIMCPICPFFQVHTDLSNIVKSWQISTHFSFRT